MCLGREGLCEIDLANVSGLILGICLEDSQSAKQLLLETIKLYNNLVLVWSSENPYLLANGKMPIVSWGITTQ